jgi:hypothetical protein
MPEQELDTERRQGVMTAVVAALSEQTEHLKYRDFDRPPRLELEEIKDALEDEEVGNEVAYLRDAGVVSTEGFQDGTLMVKLNPDVAGFAADLKDFMYERLDGSVRALASSDEYLDFEAPEGWPEWDEAERNDLAEGGFVDYSRNLGPLCAVLSIYGEERLRGADLTEYSVEALADCFSLDGYDLEIEVEKQLEILDRLGYVERYSTGLGDVYRLADNREVKQDAERIAEFRDDTFSGYPQHMALAYEEADRQELAEKGVKLVQRPETQVQ